MTSAEGHEGDARRDDTDSTHHCGAWSVWDISHGAPDERCGLAKYTDFIDIYAGLTENERRRYQREHPEESSTMKGIVTRAREEGMEQGMQRGRVEGERTVLERQLLRRFGRLPAATARRLDGASQADLEAENVLDARSLDEVFG